MADCYKIDKGSVARSIRKLEELNLINKIWDSHIFEKIDIDEMRVREVFNLISDVSIETYRELKEGGNNDN